MSKLAFCLLCLLKWGPKGNGKIKTRNKLSNRTTEIDNYTQNRNYNKKVLGFIWSADRCMCDK